MSEPTPKANKRTHLRVIEGGRGLPGAAPVAPPTGYVQSSRVTPAEREENRLREEILRLPVPDVGQSVDQTLQEISDKLDTGEDYDFSRVAYITDQLEAMGLRFCLARPEMDLAREGYLLLAWPDRLLRKHPELAELHPLAHASMPLG